MKSEFQIRIEIKDMYRFLMYHSYHGFQGIFSIVAAIALIVFWTVRRNTVSNSWIYLAFAVLFLVYIPWNMFMSASKTVKLGTAFKEPIHYELDEQGIRIHQGEASAEVTWDKVYKVCESGKNILVYTSQKNAFIWVKSQMGPAEKEAREILTKYVESKKVKL